MHLHQVLTGAVNPGDCCYSVGSVNDVPFTTAADARTARAEGQLRRLCPDSSCRHIVTGSRAEPSGAERSRAEPSGSAPAVTDPVLARRCGLNALSSGAFGVKPSADHRLRSSAAQL
ncbi:DmX-like protein 2 [Liparis tanakae]|uniref:DmX-like protein 2 n=1 Tax=Liparis tanakae TaxID=230148 RepID=A0A4Z2ENE1_9TELE|nr:DmX-like protein 2 [Liparis tanakae]